ncbi:phage tail protein [Escherichia coli]|nr:phage tail protein [Escherichia coli]
MPSLRRRLFRCVSIRETRTAFAITAVTSTYRKRSHRG